MKTVILSWFQNNASTGFTVDQLKGNNFHQPFDQMLPLSWSTENPLHGVLPDFQMLKGH